MNRPTDQSSRGENLNDSSDLLKPVFKKIPMIDPGFREEPEQSVLRPRILGIKKPTHPHDRSNLKFLGAAVLVAIVIFGVLEYKQFREAAGDGATSISTHPVLK